MEFYYDKEKNVLRRYFSENVSSSSKKFKKKLAEFLGFETVAEIAKKVAQEGDSGIFYPIPEIDRNTFTLPSKLEPNMAFRDNNGKVFSKY